MPFIHEPTVRTFGTESAANLAAARVAANGGPILDVKRRGDQYALTAPTRDLADQSEAMLTRLWPGQYPSTAHSPIWPHDESPQTMRDREDQRRAEAQEEADEEADEEAGLISDWLNDLTADEAWDEADRASDRFGPHSYRARMFRNLAKEREREEEHEGEGPSGPYADDLSQD